MTHLAPHRLAYCTIASANYLPRVQVFLRALSAHQPDAEAFVLLCETEEVCRRIADETSFPFLSPAAICPEHWMEMAFQYDVIEFNTAMKPFLLDALLDKGFDGVFYFDPDISIYSSLEPLEHALASHDVVLTPHACHPVPEDGCVPAMADYLRAGQFNLGFVGMAGSANGRTMLAWWKAVCRDRCIFDPTYRLFVDQFWAAAFASFAERLCVLPPRCERCLLELVSAGAGVRRYGMARGRGGAPILPFQRTGLGGSDPGVALSEPRQRAAG